MESSMHLDQTFRARAAVLFGALAIASTFSVTAASATGVISGFPGVYESVRQKICTAKTVCFFNFDNVPANSLLEATNLNCLVNTVGADPENLVILNLFNRPPAGASPTARTGFPMLNSNQGSSTTTVFGLNEEIRMFFRSNNLAVASVSFAKPINIVMTCTLSGNLLKKA
jgi:hypothetical protein